MVDFSPQVNAFLIQCISLTYILHRISIKCHIRCTEKYRKLSMLHKSCMHPFPCASRVFLSNVSYPELLASVTTSVSTVISWKLCMFFSLQPSSHFLHIRRLHVVWPVFLRRGSGIHARPAFLPSYNSAISFNRHYPALEYTRTSFPAYLNDNTTFNGEYKWWTSLLKSMHF